MRKRVEKTTSFIKGAVLGGLACGLTALLMAPKAGKKLRKDIANKYHDIKDDAFDALDELTEHTKELTENSKKAAKKFVKKIKK